MNELLRSFLNWIKVPYDKASLRKHTEVISDIHATQVITKHMSEQIISERYQKQRGSNSIDRAILGNRHVRKRTNP
jgi:hypothetical protein